MLIQNEREDGEVTEDEEEYLPVPQKRRADEIVTVTPNIEDLRLAVFRSVVQRKLTEKKVDNKLAFSSSFTKTERVKELDENDGSSSDMEVETWDSNRDAKVQVDCRPETLKAPNTTVCEAVTSSVPTAVDEPSANLDFESPIVINERKSVFSVVFYFKESERLDTFGLGLKEQMKRKKAKNAVANSAAIENQRLAASFSFWSADTSNAGNTAVDRSTNLGFTATVGSMDISSLAVLPVECIPSVSSSSSGKSATVTHTQSRTAEVRSNPEDSLILVDSSSAAPLTAAQQRMKMVEDIARLKLEILLREKKSKAKDNGATNLDDEAKRSRARAQASRIPTSRPTSALLPTSSDSGRTVSTFNTGGKIPSQTKTSDNSVLLPIPTSGHNQAPSSQSTPFIPPTAKKSQTMPSVQGQRQGQSQSQSQTEETLRAAALVSRKKRRREDSAPSPAEDKTIKGKSQSLSVAAGLSAPVPIPTPVPAPVAVAVPRVQHTLYPSSRTRLGFSILGTEHLALAPALPSNPLPLPHSNSQKRQVSSTAQSISSSSTFGQNRRYVPTRTSSEDSPSATALYSTLMDIGVGLNAPSSSSSSRSSSKRLSAEGQRKGREGSFKTKMSAKLKITVDVQNIDSLPSTAMEEERYSHSTGTWTGSGPSSSNHRGHGVGVGGIEAPAPLSAGLYSAGGGNGLDYSYSYNQHDSLSHVQGPPEGRLEDWYRPPDLGPESRNVASSSRPRPPQTVVPPPPPPVQSQLSEDFIRRVRRLKELRLKSSNTVASVSTDSELEFGEIFEAVRSTDKIVTPRDPPSCLTADSDTDMSVEEEIEVGVEEEVGASIHSATHPAVEHGRSAVLEVSAPIPSAETAAAAPVSCDPMGMVGMLEDSSLIGPEALTLTAPSGIIPATVSDSHSLVAPDIPDILVTNSPDSDVDTAATEASLTTPMLVTNLSSSSSASASEMRALHLREAELKVCSQTSFIYLLLPSLRTSSISMSPPFPCVPALSFLSPIPLTCSFLLFRPAMNP
jgi:hypothetical protein